MLREVQKAGQLRFSFLVSKITDLCIPVVFCCLSVQYLIDAMESILKHEGGGGEFKLSQAHCGSTNSANFPKYPKVVI